MLVNVFLESAGNYEERELLLKFYEGVSKVIPPVLSFDSPTENGTYLDINHHYTTCDVAVMIGSWKPRDRDHHATRNSIVENSKCFVVVETPLLNRVMGKTSTHHRIGVNGFLNNHGTFHLGNHNSSRKELLNIQWNGWRNDPNGNILLMLQLPGDASLRGISTYDWAVKTVQRIRNYSQRKIIIRTHPSHNPKDTDEYYKFAYDLMINHTGVSFSFGNAKTVQEELKTAYCTVAYTSGSAIDSILAGVPVLAVDPGNFAFDISSHYVEEIENLKLADTAVVNQWINNLSFSQWSIEEMQNGEAITHLLPIINKVFLDNPPSKKKK